MNEDNFSVRYNVMNISSLEMFAGIRGGLHNNCKDVYFVRAVGAYPALAADIEKMDCILAKQVLAGQCRYNRVSSFPALVEMEEITAYTKYYEEWLKEKRTVNTKAARENKTLGRMLGKACDAVLTLFEQQNPGVSSTMRKNFAVKLLYWFDKVGAALTERWVPGAAMKIVAQNISRKQEYLFCYFLTQMGIDVLLLQCRTDIGEELERLSLSKKFVLGAMQDCGISQYDISKYSIFRTGKKQTHTGEEKTDNRVLYQEARPVVHLPERPNRARTQTAENGRNGSIAARSAAVEPFYGKQQRTGRRELEFEELALLAASVVMIVIHDRTGKPTGSGSGIMVGKDGYILTNNHVANGGMFYSVKIENDEEVYMTDEVIKYNSVLDLALLRIQRRLKSLPVYAGDKELVRGQKVVAIGSPLGLFNSVSDGIISAFRNVDGVEMIQFTAPISHGSSGGALLNMYGEVIGISTAGMDSGQNLNLAVGYKNIRQFIQGFV